MSNKDSDTNPPVDFLHDCFVLAIQFSSCLSDDCAKKAFRKLGGQGCPPSLRNAFLAHSSELAKISWLSENDNKGTQRCFKSHSRLGKYSAKGL